MQPSERKEHELWACEYAMEHREELLIISANVLRTKPYRDERVEEMFSDLMIRNLPAILFNWNPEIGELEKHVRHQWRLYSMKWLYRYDRDHKREALAQPESEGWVIAVHNLDAEDALELVQQACGPHLFAFLRMRHMEGRAVTEICDHFRLSRGTVLAKIKQAEAVAQEALHDCF